MKFVVDMNLSPAWIPVLQASGHDAVHWSTVGLPGAPDNQILAWAKANGHIVFTHDLDFGTILAVTGADAPSVVQFRAQDVTPDGTGGLLLSVVERFATQLDVGCLMSIDKQRALVRLLPLGLPFGRGEGEPGSA